MGADFLSAMIAHRQGVTPDYEKAWAYIDSLQVDDLVRLNGDNVEYDFDELDWVEVKEMTCTYSTPALTQENLDEVKRVLKEWIQILCCEDGSNCWDMCGWTVYFTGGMSWGDDPSDAFTTFSRVDNWGTLAIEVFKAAGFDFPPTGPDVFIMNEEPVFSDIRKVSP